MELCECYMDDLNGLRIVITRARKQANEFDRQLRKRGAEVIPFPAIRIAPLVDTSKLDSALSALDSYDWLILTSVNGVDAVWDRISELGTAPGFHEVNVAAIGPKTAAELERRGVTPNFVPDEYIAEAILLGLGDPRGQRFLLARAELARPALANALREAGGEFDDLACYRTLPEKPDRRALSELRAGVDIVTFTSPSTATCFAQILQTEGIDPTAIPGDPLIACIGPITAATVGEIGMNADIVADLYTTEGLIEAMAAFHNPIKVGVK